MNYQQAITEALELNPVVNFMLRKDGEVRMIISYKKDLRVPGNFIAQKGDKSASVNLETAAKVLSAQAAASGWSVEQVM